MGMGYQQNSQWGKDGCLLSRESGMEASVYSFAGNLFPEGRLIHDYFYYY